MQQVCVSVFVLYSIYRYTSITERVVIGGKLHNDIVRGVSINYINWPFRGAGIYNVYISNYVSTQHHAHAK